MQVNSIYTPQRTSEDKIKNPNTLDENDFYQILITQLQNQDPLDPLKPDEYVAQLTQFAQLEAVNDVKHMFENLMFYQTSINNLLALNLLGKEVKAEGDIIHLEKDKDATIHYQLLDDAQKVSIHIYNEDGKLVRTIEVGAQSEGEQSIIWDGRDDKGHHLPSGDYTFSVTAIKDGLSIGVNTYMVGPVTKVEFDNNKLYLTIGESKHLVSLEDIIEIKQ